MSWFSAIIAGRSGSGKSYLVAKYLGGIKIPHFPPINIYDAIWVCDVTGTFQMYSHMFPYFRKADSRVWKYSIFVTPSENSIYRAYSLLKRVKGEKLLIIDDLSAAYSKDRRKLGAFLSDARNHQISWIITTQRIKNFAPVLIQNARCLVVFPYRKLEDLREVLSNQDIREVTKLRQHQYVVFEL